MVDWLIDDLRIFVVVNLDILKILECDWFLN
jgi:hypothetical protein